MTSRAHVCLCCFFLCIAAIQSLSLYYLIFALNQSNPRTTGSGCRFTHGRHRKRATVVSINGAISDAGLPNYRLLVYWTNTMSLERPSSTRSSVLGESQIHRTCVNRDTRALAGHLSQLLRTVVSARCSISGAPGAFQLVEKNLNTSGANWQLSEYETSTSTPQWKLSIF